MQKRRLFPHLDTRLHPWLFGLAILFALGAIVLGVVSYPAAAREAESAKWPVLRGKVVKVAILEGADGPLERYIAYSFERGGRTWTVAEQEPLPTTDFGRIVRDDYAQYRPGSEAAIHFNPDDPSQCWVRRTDSAADTILFALATLLTALVFAGAAETLRRAELKRAAADATFCKTEPGALRRELFAIC